MSVCFYVLHLFYLEDDNKCYGIYLFIHYKIQLGLKKKKRNYARTFLEMLTINRLTLGANYAAITVTLSDEMQAIKFICTYRSVNDMLRY